MSYYSFCGYGWCWSPGGGGGIPYFPDETHDLVRDWATFSFYLVFFVTGLILVSNSRLRDTVMRQRGLYLIETVASTAFMFATPHLFSRNGAIDLAWDIAAIFVAWSCSMTMIGYCRRYLNRDSKFRKLANEAIYPFYLLHQPVIVVVGSLVVAWQIPVLVKALIIITLSLAIIVSVYWFVIRPVNLLRVIFGLKAREIETNALNPEIFKVIPAPLVRLFIR